MEINDVPPYGLHVFVNWSPGLTLYDHLLWFTLVWGQLQQYIVCSHEIESSGIYSRYDDLQSTSGEYL